MAGQGGVMVDADGGGAATAVRFRVRDMDCTHCVTRIEDGLRKVDGVMGVGANLVGRTVTVEIDAGRVESDEVRRAIGRLGHLAEPDTGARRERATATWTTPDARIDRNNRLSLSTTLGSCTLKQCTLPMKVEI